jgi:C1A family cysteine protease
MKVFIITALAIVSLAAFVHSHRPGKKFQLRPDFENWARGVGRKVDGWDDDKAERRQKAFDKTRDFIQTFRTKHRKNYHFDVDFTTMSDRTDEEHAAMMGTNSDFADHDHSHHTRALPGAYNPAGFTNVPASLDYRTHFPAVQDQGKCGSCWAFATIANFSKIKILTF